MGKTLIQFYNSISHLKLIRPALYFTISDLLHYCSFSSPSMDNPVEATEIPAIKIESNTSEDLLQSKPETMSHQEALTVVENGITELIMSDPLLQYLPSDVTLDELNSLLALEHGRAMTVIIHRADNQKYSVVVEQKATVMDLKKAIQRHVTLKLVSLVLIYATYS